MVTKILRPEIQEMIRKAHDEGTEVVITYGETLGNLEDLELWGKLSEINNAEVYYMNKKELGGVWFKANNPEELDEFYNDLLNGVYDSEIKEIEESLERNEWKFNEKTNYKEIKTENILVQLDIDGVHFTKTGNIVIETLDLVGEDMKQVLLDVLEI